MAARRRGLVLQRRVHRDSVRRLPRGAAVKPYSFHRVNTKRVLTLWLLDVSRRPGRTNMVIPVNEQRNVQHELLSTRVDAELHTVNFPPAKLVRRRESRPIAVGLGRAILN